MRSLPLTVLSCVAVAAACGLPALADDPFAKWEEAVARLEAQNRDAAAGGVVFYGSSSIRLWNLRESFPTKRFINAGFGGSTIATCTHFADRLVMVHSPRTVVFYAGDNDINSGRTPRQVHDDFAAFVAAVHRRLPDCRVLFVAIKPSLARWTQYGVQSEANALVREFCTRDRRLAYVDIVPAMLGDDGKPAPRLFVNDGLHLSAEGYALWTPIVTAALAR